MQARGGASLTTAQLVLTVEWVGGAMIIRGSPSRLGGWLPQIPGVPGLVLVSSWWTLAVDKIHWRPIMQKTTWLLSAVVLLTMVLATQGDARRGGGHHAGRGHATVHRSANTQRHASVNRAVHRSANVNRSINRNVSRNVNVNRRYVYRNGQRGYWRNGVWVAAPAAAVGYVASCANEYKQWEAPGSAYWRHRYYQCKG